MKCDFEQICGGCPLRHLTENEYRQNKSARFSQLLKAINQPNISLGEPVFIADGNRRRAELTFSYKKGLLTLGFNAAQSHEIVNITTCPALTPKLNAVLPQIRTFLSDFCAIKTTVKVKNKLQTQQITGGEIWLTEADNGIDVLLEIDTPLALEHRLLISEFTQNTAEVIRFSCGKKYSSPETVAQKTAPQINIGDRSVFIPAGTFLQPSKAGEQALIDLVMRYVGSTVGNIADLFCGIGTFSYPLSNNIKNKITAVDSSTELLAGFQKTVNALSIPNIKIEQKNLFKYPLEELELKNFAVVVFDPPRAGAGAQTKKIAALPHADKPQKIVAVSCNPNTFINDANTLLAGGYHLTKITMVDQFVFSPHFELVALFEKGEN